MFNVHHWSTRLLFALAITATASGCGMQRAEIPDQVYYRTWSTYLGDPARNHYSTLDQINTSNVHQLQVAWTYHAGDAREDNRSQIQCNPIIVDSVLYATSPQLKVLALHAATGEELWRFDPFAEAVEGSDRLVTLGVNRGVVYWEDGEDRRILFTAGPKLFALDARTGMPISTFGTNGTVDLRDGLGRDVSDLFIVSNTPGAVYRHLLILGSRVTEGPDAAPGHIRAYDIRTGEIAWIFHTIPHPGEYGYETWPKDAWKSVGGANDWSGMSVDEERGLVFASTGSAAYDFYGGNRHGENLFANSILALDAETGARRWHFQTIHHDLWDRDLPAPPNLITVEHEGRRVDAVAQITKTGFVFLLDRETGEPLFPVEEQPVPPSNLDGEQVWPTQPIPVKPPPFVRQEYTEEDVPDRTPEARAYVLERLRRIRKDHLFAPPDVGGTLIFPGFDGGGEWGGAAFDPESGHLYVNANEMPWILTMVDVRPQPGQQQASVGKYLYTTYCASCHGVDRRGDGLTYPSLLHVGSRLSRADVRTLLAHGRGLMPSFASLSEAETEALVAFLFELEDAELSEEADGEAVPAAPPVPYAHTGWHRFLDPDGYPAIKPPWGTLNAIDLNTGEIAWKVTLGEYPELTAQDIARTGTENYGGPVVTAGGLLFIAATRDEMFRAFDKRTGALLWEAKLPAGGYATPATYEVNGKQYVVIAAGGGKLGTRSGDAYVAFALPD